MSEGRMLDPDTTEGSLCLLRVRLCSSDVPPVPSPLSRESWAQSVLRQLGPLSSSVLRFSSPGKSSRAGGVRCPGTNRSQPETPDHDACWSPTLRIRDGSFGYRCGHSGSLTTAGSYPWMKDRMGVIMIQAPGHRWRPHSHLLFCILGTRSRISLITKVASDSQVNREWTRGKCFI